jgi:hypothetical protein
MIVVIQNPKNGLKKEIETLKFTSKQIDKILSFYRKIGWLKEIK